MSDYVLSCCSTVDLTAEHIAARNLSHICFHFQLDGVSYPDDLGKSVPFETFYRKMTEGAETSTSQINIAEYLDYFEGFLKEGKDVLHITFSSGLSGSYLSARSAADIARERYPERKLFVVDSLAAKLPLINKTGLYEKLVKNAGSSDYKVLSENMRATMSRVVNEDLRGYLPKINVPTLLVWGNKDTATPIGDAHIMDSLLPDSGIVVLEG
ncbi:MAG: DegV family protein, partial [Oscillospiraceae bacterium]|nr:DegV family protein [Oscillospiraceae bacterium]